LNNSIIPWPLISVIFFIATIPLHLFEQNIVRFFGE